MIRRWEAADHSIPALERPPQALRESFIPFSGWA